MKLYVLWFHEWESNNIVGIFETEQEAERWRVYFLENPDSHEEDDDNEYSLLSDMAHFAGNGELEDRLKIEELVVGQLTNHVKVNNLKLLEWEAKKNEEKNTQSLS